MAFDVWPTPLAATQLNGLRGTARDAAKQRRQDLIAQGCQAARWRMSGPTVDHLCEVYLTGQWRMIVAFPAPDEVCIVCVGEHDEGSPNNIYNLVYELAGVDPPTGRRRVPCCERANEVPVNPELVDRLADAAKRFR